MRAKEKRVGRVGFRLLGIRDVALRDRTGSAKGTGGVTFRIHRARAAPEVPQAPEA